MKGTDVTVCRYKDSSQDIRKRKNSVNEKIGVKK